MQKEEGEGSKTVKVERGRKSEKANVKQEDVKDKHVQGKESVEVRIGGIRGQYNLLKISIEYSALMQPR